MPSASTWTPAHTRYAEKIAIRMAVEILGGARPEYWYPTVRAAWHLGVTGNGRQAMLQDVAAILVLHRVPLIPTIRRALGK